MLYLIAEHEAIADHSLPRTFDTIAKAFIEAREIDPSKDFVTFGADDSYEPRLVDRSLAKAWRKYHHKLAAIRVVSEHERRSTANRGKVRPRDRQLDL